MTIRRLTTICLAALLVLGLGLAPAAGASRKATAAEAKAIKKGFFKGRSKAATRIRGIRVSTVSARYAAVAYSADVKISVFTKAPSPVVLKKSGKAWAKVASAKVPAKVKKDLKKKAAASNVSITGEINATLTRGATCSAGGVNIYDPGQDILLSMQLFTSKGPGTYDAKGVGTVVGIYRNSGTELAYESGQPNDATIPSGFFHIDALRWGIIDADLSKPPTATINPLAVFVKGTWDCR